MDDLFPTSARKLPYNGGTALASAFFVKRKRACLKTALLAWISHFTSLRSRGKSLLARGINLNFRLTLFKSPSLHPGEPAPVEFPELAPHEYTGIAHGVVLL